MIKYKTISTGSALSDADLDAQWKEGYELVTAVSRDNHPFTYHFKYKGGVRGGRSVRGGS